MDAKRDHQVFSKIPIVEVLAFRLLLLADHTYGRTTANTYARDQSKRLSSLAISNPLSNFTCCIDFMPVDCAGFDVYHTYVHAFLILLLLRLGMILRQILWYKSNFL